MRKHRFTIVLLTLTSLSGGGCASWRPKDETGPATKRVTTTVRQTGSNIGRRLEVADSGEAPAPEEPAKPKKKTSQVEAAEDIVTRGGFR